MLNMVILRSVLFLHSGFSFHSLSNKVKLLLLIIANWSALRLFLLRMSRVLGKSDFERMGVGCVGVVQWPYISMHWTVQERLDVLASHYEMVAKNCSRLLLLKSGEKLMLGDLSDCSCECALVLDRPEWFVREGELVLNLFQGGLRVASLAFTFCHVEDEVCIFIGAIQGVHRGVGGDKSLDIYRGLTKDFEGLRPRSLLIEALKCIARKISVEKIYAVRDDFRHHRHPYFGVEKAKDLVADYDSIWLEHGATSSGREDFFEIPVLLSRKSIDEIPSKKRAMYRRRYELLDGVFIKIDKGFGDNYAAHASSN